MTTFKLARYVFASILLLSVGSVAQALTLSVNCGSKEGEGLTSIGAALKALQGAFGSLPNTINVRGACHENILIQNMDRLTLNAVNGASITDASYGTREVIDVEHSTGFTLNGFTITATCPSTCMNGPGADGIDCYQSAECLLINNTISGAGNGAGIGVYPLSKIMVQGGTLQNNYFGLYSNDGGELFVMGVTAQNNLYGVFLQHGGSVSIHVGADGVTPSVISNNTQQGIFANLGATVSMHAPAYVTNNGADGILLALGSKLFLGGGSSGGVSITGNAGSGVSLNDISIAQFGGNAHVTGNAAPNIACNAPTVVTSGAIAAAGGIPGLPYTNCTN
ncbi:MAG TPA: right-handed parallel beta-helix repeat-containing protein [Steroidobacteraceae bacterium]|nr:right-handed parallel beta-helix repeat-containing protein [Steroidobacteraceae bacterium]